jgi:EpsI family protein
VIEQLSSWQRFLPVALLLAATAFALGARGTKEVLPPHEGLSAFPMQVFEWRGRELALTPATLEVLGPGQFLSRDYERSPSEAPVNLFIAYFPSQRTSDTIHSPKNCLPGAGWAPLESGRISLRRPDGSRIVVNRYLIGKGASKDIVLYWYQAHGRVTPSEYWAKIFLATDAIRLNRTDGALVRVVTPFEQSEGETKAQERAISFSEQILFRLDAYIPK